MKKAFTLAEVMIVLTVIGVLTAILLPVARQSMPDKDLMKFKKAHNTLGTVIRELVTSDKYYLDGDLGVRADGTLIDGTHEGDYTYFCKTFADFLNNKSTTCRENMHTQYKYMVISNDDSESGTTALDYMDLACDFIFTESGSEIVTLDNVHYYQASPQNTFGQNKTDSGSTDCKRIFCTSYMNSEDCPCYMTQEMFPKYGKLFCIDIDGDNEQRAFGYAIRADGKIVAGARAQQWLERDINEE